MNRNRNCLIVFDPEMSSFATDLAHSLSVRAYAIERGKYDNDNSWVRLPSIALPHAVLVVASSFAPVNDNLVTLCLLLDAIRRKRRPRILALLPHFPYARSDTWDEKSGLGFTAICSMLAAAGADRVVTLDLHSIHTASNGLLPIYDVSSVHFFAERIKSLKLDDITVVSPDLGGCKRAENLAQVLQAELAIFRKQRSPGEARFVRDFCGGLLERRNTILYDEEVVTGASKCSIATQLLSLGAKAVYGVFTHSDIQSRRSYNDLLQSDFRRIIVSDSTPIISQINRWGQNDKFEILPVGEVLGRWLKSTSVWNWFAS